MAARRCLAAATAGLSVLITGCASLPPASVPPTLLTAQRLVLDAATGEHQLLAVDAGRAQDQLITHPGRLVRATGPTSGVVRLGNVSIPLDLGAGRAPLALQPAPSHSEESSP